MNNPEYEAEIKHIVFNNLKTYTNILKSQRNKHLYNYIIENTPKLNNKKFRFCTRVNWIIHGLTDFPSCVVCGRSIEKNIPVTWNYSRTCSVDCANNDIEKKKAIKRTKKKHYGDENFVNPEKAKQTKFERYGDPNYNNTAKNLETFNQHKKDENFLKEIDRKRKATNYLKHNDKNYTNRTKAKKTCVERYGVAYPMQNKAIKNKTEMYFIEKLGVDNPWKADTVKKQIKITKKEKYGNENFSNTEQAKVTFARHKIENPNFLEDIRKKQVKTNQEKFGKPYYSQTQEFKDMWDNEVFKQKTVQKIIDSKKRNNTFNVSKKEESCFTLLKEKFPNVLRQYCSEAYPFNCDFYIPEKDLYIEFNGTWTHGGHAFDPNNEEDVKRVKTWAMKNTKFYNNAIKNWTERDVKKRETAKANNLNFIEFWNIDEVKQWLGKISS